MLWKELNFIRQVFPTSTRNSIIWLLSSKTAHMVIQQSFQAFSYNRYPYSSGNNWIFHWVLNHSFLLPLIETVCQLKKIINDRILQKKQLEIIVCDYFTVLLDESTNDRGFIRSVFDMVISILWTLIWVCSNLILSEIKTTSNNNSCFRSCQSRNKKINAMCSP